MRVLRYASGHTDKQADIHTHTFIAILRSPTGGEITTHTVRRVQEADGAPSAAELQEKLSLKSDDDKTKMLNGRLAAAAGLDRTVFDDF